MFLSLSRGESEREDRRTQGISGLSFQYYIIVCIAIYFLSLCYCLVVFLFMLIAFVFNRHLRCDLARVVGANIWLTLRYIKRQGNRRRKCKRLGCNAKKYRVCTVHQSLIIILVKGKEVINNGTVYLVHGPEVEGHFPLNHLCI